MFLVCKSTQTKKRQDTFGYCVIKKGEEERISDFGVCIANRQKLLNSMKNSKAWN